MQISVEFKEHLRGQKKDNESFEDCLKRLLSNKSEIPSIDYSIDEIPPSIECEIPEIPSFRKKLFFIDFSKLNPKMFENKKKKRLSKKEKIIDESKASCFCKKHNLPAIYDSSDKKWKCNLCFSEQRTEIKKEYVEVTSHFGSIREIQSPIQEIKIIPFDVVKNIERMQNY